MHVPPGKVPAWGLGGSGEGGVEGGCTCLQLEQKTIVFCCRWLLTNDHSVSSFCGASTTM